MRILHICTRFAAGGIQRHVIDLSEWLRGNGHKVFIAGSPDVWMNEDIDDGFFALDLNGVAEGGGNKFVRICNIFRCAAKLRGILKRNRIEIIHAHESAPAIVARLASLGMNLRRLVTYHGSEPERVGQFGRIARMTTHWIITPSHLTARNLRKIGGVPESRIRVIGLGVKPADSIDQNVVSRRREELLGEQGKLLVVTVARLVHQKGMDVLVDVVRRVTESRRDIRFVVVGEGPQVQEVKSWAAEAAVESQLQFVGQSEEPYLYLKAADLFLLTSRWEALPISIVEAFRAGLPVVATDTGGVSEMVASSVGRVEAVEDAEALANSVLEICGNDELRNKMSAAALELSAEDRFSPAYIHQLFERTYEEFLGGDQPPNAATSSNQPSQS